MKHINYSKEQLEPIVARCTSFSQVARELNRSPVGGTLTNLRLMCSRFGISTDHMSGQAHSKGQVSKQKVDPILRLVEGKPTDHRLQPHYLRAGLLALGIKHECADCGQEPEWRNKPLVLEVDHKDGKYWNNKPENLQFLCPNCHSQYGTSNKTVRS